MFIYTTLNHIKYVLPTPSGDTGIVRTLDVPVYLTECNDTTLHCLDRDGKTLSILIDNSGASRGLCLCLNLHLC